ncbi:MAG TPA: CsbD family protein [Candidatus Nitrosotalea sp.]|nr:CsbD family protein [Candidatus Nitrosotalea sp.]
MKDKVQGKMEETKGRVTQDPVEEAKGKARQRLGEAKTEVSRRAHEDDARTP